MSLLHLYARRAPVEVPRAAAEIALRARESARLQARERLRELRREDRELARGGPRTVTRIRARRAWARLLGV